MTAIHWLMIGVVLGLYGLLCGRLGRLLWPVEFLRVLRITFYTVIDLECFPGYDPEESEVDNGFCHGFYVLGLLVGWVAWTALITAVFRYFDGAARAVTVLEIGGGFLFYWALYRLSEGRGSVWNSISLSFIGMAMFFLGVDRHNDWQTTVIILGGSAIAVWWVGQASDGPRDPLRRSWIHRLFF